MKKILGINEKEFKEILKVIGEEAELTEKWGYQPYSEGVTIWRTSFKGKHYLRFGYYEENNTKEKAEKIINTPTFKKHFNNYEVQLCRDSFSGQQVYRIYLKEEGV